MSLCQQGETNYMMSQAMKVNWNINAAVAAILVFGASIFSACSKDDDEKGSGVDTTNRVDKWKWVWP